MDAALFSGLLAALGDGRVGAGAWRVRWRDQRWMDDDAVAAGLRPWSWGSRDFIACHVNGMLWVV